MSEKSVVTAYFRQFVGNSCAFSVNTASSLFQLTRGHRLEILKIFVVFAKHKAKMPKKTDVSGTGLTWETLQRELSVNLQHLQKIDDGFMDELLDCSQNPDLKGYIESFEMTAGTKDKVSNLGNYQANYDSSSCFRGELVSIRAMTHSQINEQKTKVCTIAV